MFLRCLVSACALVIALVIARVVDAHQPLSAAGDDNDCALYLTGPGRTSAFDYNLNLLRGNFAYDGQHTCITYDAINQAYLDARKRINVAQPKGDWKAEDIASVGELMLDISISLARTYGLTYEEIEKGLPLIDTSKTLIRETCPPVFSHVECRPGKYRRFDGLCNNLQHPTWGATMSPFQRLIGPLFADGINAPRISTAGRDLPLSRVVSRTMHPDDGFHDHAGTVMVIAWGQFMDHDYTLTATPLDPRNRNDPEECCKRPPHLKHPYCNEIRIPDDDYFYRLFHVKCIDFVRGFPSPRPGCKLGSRVPFNTLTGVLDGNTVYGVTEKFARKLRTGFGGLLRMNPVFEEYGLKDLLPLKLDIPDEGCTRPNKSMYCFEAGEIRVNEQLVLTVMHTLMAREHNRVAKGLAGVNPHWDDETLFQEARRINIAEIQHITFNEFLPILLGKDVMEKFGLLLNKEGYWEGYDPSVNPDVIDSFASAAYRFGHSLLPTAVERWSKAHKFIASKRLSDLIRRPYDLYRAGVLDEYIMGLMNQVAQAMDDSITQEVTNHLFKKVGARFGMDLVSFNMQRGREFGIPGYMEFRKFCGLPGAETFQELFGSMPNETIRKYESIFEHPSDVDLWSGGVSERPLPGSMLGPTFACIIATQFSYSRRGDRFWYELPNQPSSFTPEQLVEVRKARLSRIICDNTDIIDTVQVYPMVLPDHELNPRVPCRSGIIPSMDFSKWAEHPQFDAAASRQYYTEAAFSDLTDTSEVNCTMELEEQPEITVETEMVQQCDITTELTEEATTPTEQQNNQEIVTQTNDQVIKYVIKDKTDTANSKITGHPKNALRRKRNVADAITLHPALAAIPIEFKEPDTYEIVTTPKPVIKEDLSATSPQVFPEFQPIPVLPEGYLERFNITPQQLSFIQDRLNKTITITIVDKKSSKPLIYQDPDKNNDEQVDHNEEDESETKPLKYISPENDYRGDDEYDHTKYEKSLKNEDDAKYDDRRPKSGRPHKVSYEEENDEEERYRPSSGKQHKNAKQEYDGIPKPYSKYSQEENDEFYQKNRKKTNFDGDEIEELQEDKSRKQNESFYRNENEDGKHSKIEIPYKNFNQADNKDTEDARSYKKFDQDDYDEHEEDRLRPRPFHESLERQENYNRNHPNSERPYATTSRKENEDVSTDTQTLEEPYQRINNGENIDQKYNPRVDRPHKRLNHDKNEYITKRTNSNFRKEEIDESNNEEEKPHNLNRKQANMIKEIRRNPKIDDDNENEDEERNLIRHDAKDPNLNATQSTHDELGQESLEEMNKKQNITYNKVHTGYRTIENEESEQDFRPLTGSRSSQKQHVDLKEATEDLPRRPHNSELNLKQKSSSIRRDKTRHSINNEADVYDEENHDNEEHQRNQKQNSARNLDIVPDNPYNKVYTGYRTIDNEKDKQDFRPINYIRGSQKQHTDLEDDTEDQPSVPYDPDINLNEKASNIRHPTTADEYYDENRDNDDDQRYQSKVNSARHLEINPINGQIHTNKNTNDDDEDDDDDDDDVNTNPRTLEYVSEDDRSEEINSEKPHPYEDRNENDDDRPPRRYNSKPESEYSLDAVRIQPSGKIKSAYYRNNDNSDNQDHDDRHAKKPYYHNQDDSLDKNVENPGKPILISDTDEDPDTSKNPEELSQNYQKDNAPEIEGHIFYPPVMSLNDIRPLSVDIQNNYKSYKSVEAENDKPQRFNLNPGITSEGSLDDIKPTKATKHSNSPHLNYEEQENYDEPINTPKLFYERIENTGENDESRKPEIKYNNYDRLELSEDEHTPRHYPDSSVNIKQQWQNRNKKDQNEDVDERSHPQNSKPLYISEGSQADIRQTDENNHRDDVRNNKYYYIDKGNYESSINPEKIIKRPVLYDTYKQLERDSNPMLKTMKQSANLPVEESLNKIYSQIAYKALLSDDDKPEPVNQRSHNLRLNHPQRVRQKPYPKKYHKGEEEDYRPASNFNRKLKWVENSEEEQDKSSEKFENSSQQNDEDDSKETKGQSIHSGNSPNENIISYEIHHNKNSKESLEERGIHRKPITSYETNHGENNNASSDEEKILIKPIISYETHHNENSKESLENKKGINRKPKISYETHHHIKSNDYPTAKYKSADIKRDHLKHAQDNRRPEVSYEVYHDGAPKNSQKPQSYNLKLEPNSNENSDDLKGKYTQDPNLSKEKSYDDKEFSVFDKLHARTYDEYIPRVYNKHSELPDLTARDPEGNVKQQFEKIPLNYMHDTSKKPKKSNNLKTVSSEENDESTETTDKDGKPVPEEALATPPTENDPELEIRFKDGKLDLPEIKLPESVLGYYDSPKEEDDDNQDQSKGELKENEDNQDQSKGELKENDENSDEDEGPPLKPYDDTPYEPPKRTIDSDDDELYGKFFNDDVDLYESFVRDSFNKKGTFEERAEKITQDPVLKETIQDVLDHTKKKTKEAENGKNPKYGYMWTMNYDKPA